MNTKSTGASRTDLRTWCDLWCKNDTCKSVCERPHELFEGDYKARHLGYTIGSHLQLDRQVMEITGNLHGQRQQGGSTAYNHYVNQLRTPGTEHVMKKYNGLYLFMESRKSLFLFSNHHPSKDYFKLFLKNRIVL